MELLKLKQPIRYLFLETVIIKIISKENIASSLDVTMARSRHFLMLLRSKFS